MLMALLILLFLFVIIVFAWSTDRLAKGVSEQEFVQCVEAGGTDKATAEELEELSFNDVKRSYRDENGNLLDRSCYGRIVVHNNCMRPRNILDKDQLLVRNIENARADQLHKRDILYLKINKNGKDYFKIRELDKVCENGELETHYYDLDGKIHKSSTNHKLEMILGVVKYNLMR